MSTFMEAIRICCTVAGALVLGGALTVVTVFIILMCGAYVVATFKVLRVLPKLLATEPKYSLWTWLQPVPSFIHSVAAGESVRANGKGDFYISIHDGTIGVYDSCKIGKFIPASEAPK